MLTNISAANKTTPLKNWTQNPSLSRNSLILDLKVDSRDFFLCW